MGRCLYKFTSGVQCRFEGGHEGGHDYDLKEWREFCS